MVIPFLVREAPHAHPYTMHKVNFTILTNPLPGRSGCTSRMKSQLHTPHLAHHTSININPSATSSTSSTLHMRPTNGTTTPRKTPSSHHQVSDPLSCFGVPVSVFCTNQTPLFYSFGKCTKITNNALHLFALIFHFFLPW